jgi:hypothetical protein
LAIPIYTAGSNENCRANLSRLCQSVLPDAEAEAVARHELALEQAERNRVARIELQERQRERDREQQLVGLHIRAKQQEIWQSNVESAARIGLAQQYRNTLMGELDAMINPPQPQPPPESEVIEVEQPAEETGLEYPKLHRWF